MKVSRLFILSIVLMAMVLGFSMHAHATLQNLGTDILGNRLIYDTDLDITWYDYTMTNSSWQNQVTWADGLFVITTVANYNDWRLPVLFDESCSGNNCTNSEMGHLYYTELGNTAGSGGFTNAGVFQDLQSRTYWSGTTETADITKAWRFITVDGSQNTGSKVSGYRAIAVMDGRAVVPEPISSILFIVGGATLGFRRFRKRITN